jgi:hypothetical protein
VVCGPKSRAGGASAILGLTVTTAGCRRFYVAISNIVILPRASAWAKHSRPFTLFLKLQAYNLRRALNILGVERLIEAVAV